MWPKLHVANTWAHATCTHAFSCMHAFSCIRIQLVFYPHSLLFLLFSPSLSESELIRQGTMIHHSVSKLLSASTSVSQTNSIYSHFIIIHPPNHFTSNTRSLSFGGACSPLNVVLSFYCGHHTFNKMLSCL